MLRAGGVDPTLLRCNGDVRWETSLGAYARQIVEGIATHWAAAPSPAAHTWARHHALGYLVRANFEQAGRHNLGVMPLRGHTVVDGRGRRRPLLIYRSGLIVDQPGAASECFQSLVAHGGVRHVLNLYTGTFPFRDMLQAEQALARRLGVAYYDAVDDPAGNWRQDVEGEENYRRNARQVMAQLASFIRARILRPDGAAPRGNVYFHCGGGMHRSGMVFGVLRRCVNHDPPALIEAEYKRHTAWRSPQSPGGFEALNLRFIREFDCALLGPGSGHMAAPPQRSESAGAPRPAAARP